MRGDQCPPKHPSLEKNSSLSTQLWSILLKLEGNSSSSSFIPSPCQIRASSGIPQFPSPREFGQLWLPENMGLHSTTPAQFTPHPPSWEKPPCKKLGGGGVVVLLEPNTTISSPRQGTVAG